MVLLRVNGTRGGDDGVACLPAGPFYLLTCGTFLRFCSGGWFVFIFVWASGWVMVEEGGKKGSVGLRGGV